MKKFEIPTGFTVSFSIPPASGPGPRVEVLGSIDGKMAEEELNSAKFSGGMFIWAASEIESMVNDVIARALFPPGKDGFIAPPGGFFRRVFLEASHLEFSGKWKIVDELIKERNLLGKKEREELGAKMRRIMTFRNAFAHGNLTYDQKDGCVLTYFSGEHRREIIDTPFIVKLESYYSEAKTALGSLEARVTGPWHRPSHESKKA